MGTPTRFPSGVTNVTKTDIMGSATFPSMLGMHVYDNDFDNYAAANWTITVTQAGAGDAAEALADAQFGVLQITNDAADNDCVFYQKVGESFKIVAGKKLWFYARFKVSDATQSDFIMGLQITDTSPLAVSDGIFFQKDDGDANLDFHVVKDATASDATAIATVADNTYLDVGFFYNGSDRVEYFVNGAKLGALATTNVPDDEELTVSFGIQNGEAVAKVMSVDRIFVAEER